MKRTNIHLTSHQLDKLKQLSHATEISVAELIRRAIDAYLLLREKEHVSLHKKA